jgi:hypothetical protein
VRWGTDWLAPVASRRTSRAISDSTRRLWGGGGIRSSAVTGRVTPTMLSMVIMAHAAEATRKPVERCCLRTYAVNISLVLPGDLTASMAVNGALVYMRLL